MKHTEALQLKWDNKTKPPGSLGVLESIAKQTGTLWHTENPKIVNPHIVVFAGDHGIAETGLVNPYPQAVTAQMVLNYVQGGAAINVLCRLHGITLMVVDAGVNFNFDNSLPVIPAKVGNGTANYLEGKAMYLEEVEHSIAKGREIVKNICLAGCNTIGFGEMGIGNSSSAALIMHHITRLPLETCTGLGTGSTTQHYNTKLDTLKNAANQHGLIQNQLTTNELLSRVGGFEIAMMYGAYTEAHAQNMLIVVDGFIASAALLCAFMENSLLLNNCIFSHLSGEKGHKALLAYLGAEPLLQLGMRLGEGTGSAMAMPIIKSACTLFEEMATFESAAVSNKLYKR